MRLIPSIAMLAAMFRGLAAMFVTLFGTDLLDGALFAVVAAVAAVAVTFTTLTTVAVAATTAAILARRARCLLRGGAGPCDPPAMRTAFIGAYGYGNLGDELCLIEAMQEFPPGEPPSGGAFAFTQNPAWTNRCVPGLAPAGSR